MRVMSDKAYALLKMYEGWRSNAYRDCVGVWTIGFGHTAAAGAPYPKSGMSITLAQGEEIFLRDTEQVWNSLKSKIKPTLNANQIGAIVSLTYNIGAGAFLRSRVFRYLNAGDFSMAAKSFAAFRMAGGKVNAGLVKRRASEIILFNTKVAPKVFFASIGPDMSTDITMPTAEEFADHDSVNGLPVEEDLTFHQQTDGVKIMDKSSIVNGVIRAGLAFAVQFLVSHGYLPGGAPNADTLALAAFMIAAVWSIGSKYIQKQETLSQAVTDLLAAYSQAQAQKAAVVPTPVNLIGK